MIEVSEFYETLRKNGANFFAGVPDSLLKDFCSFIDDTASQKMHSITANEGSAVGLAVGKYLANGGIPVVYMQNSGLGNAVNPLASLADEEVYSIPMLLLVGWRGEPGVHDEPQHVKMGKITPALLDVLGIPYIFLSNSPEDLEKDLEGLFSSLNERRSPHAIVIRKNIFNEYLSADRPAEMQYQLTREDAVECVVSKLSDKDIVVSTTGKLSRELFELRQKRGEGNEKDFLTVGSMGHASQIALGIATSIPDRKVYCFDGDGAALMHLGGWASVGEMAPRNFIHIIFNNGAHESVGGQPTAGFHVNFREIAKGCKYKRTHYAETKEQIDLAINDILTEQEGPYLLEIRVKNGARKDLGRPTKTPKENKESFQKHLQT